MGRKGDISGERENGKAAEERHTWAFLLDTGTLSLTHNSDQTNRATLISTLLLASGKFPKWDSGMAGSWCSGSVVGLVVYLSTLFPHVALHDTKWPPASPSLDSFTLLLHLWFP